MPEKTKKQEAVSAKKTKKPEKEDVKPRQAGINIGMIGHVDHGKTTLTKALTGVWTDQHSEELKRGISIKLGYADSVFRKCPKCSGTQAFTIEKKCPVCGTQTEMLRKVSFVDSPGHETLMATMLSGAALMDGAVLVVAANETCPQPQTEEHLMALSVTGVENIVVVQNKIDLVSVEEAKKSHEQIREFLNKFGYKDVPIIPMAAHFGTNIDALIEAVEKYIPNPKRDSSKSARMYVARSFDINKPGKKAIDLIGSVIGGSLISGTLKVGDEVEIKPGFKKTVSNKEVWEPITTKIVTLGIREGQLESVSPGGLIAIGTTLDPFISKADNLIGSLLGHPGTLPENKDKLSLKITMLKRVVGVSADSALKLFVNEPLVVSVGTAVSVGTILSIRGDEAEIALKRSVCVEEGSKVALSKRVNNRWRLIGYGVVG
ncbi:MAG: translation initiation factor IF-2 subunit gamma [Candidatus Diapherotrites archaeon]|nr:translation initiation factor IF-2 subunit gamma [Candidatus Diapherotrites archaeon]